MLIITLLGHPFTLTPRYYGIYIRREEIRLQQFAPTESQLSESYLSVGGDAPVQ